MMLGLFRRAVNFYQHRVVPAHCSANGIKDLYQTPGPTGDITAIIIGAIIIPWTEQLAEEKTMGCEYLNSVKSGLSGSNRRLTIGIREFLKVLRGHSSDP
jgi:hypothetical protein